MSDVLRGSKGAIWTPELIKAIKNYARKAELSVQA